MSAEADIRARLDRFVTDLTSLVRLATVAAFEEAFESQRDAVRPASRAAAAPRRRVTKTSTKRVRRTAPGRAEATGELEAGSAGSEKKPRRRTSKPAKTQPPSEGANSSKQLTLPLE